MKMQPECIPCLLGRVYFETRLVNEKLAYKTMRECCRVIGEEFGEGVNSAMVATKIHKKAYDVLEVKDPYEKIKKESNTVAYQLYPRAEIFVEEAEDKLKAAAIVSIAGNLLDFGISDISTPYALLSMFDKVCKEGLGWDDTGRVISLLKKAKNVLFFTDNCGEIVFDQLLLTQIRKYGVNLTLVPKGVPILTDATLKDIRQVGLDRIVNEVLDSGAFAVGVDFNSIDMKLKRRLEFADLIISKGMGNYESFSDTDYKPIVYLLRAKCVPVANSMGVRKDTNVVKLYV